MPSPYEKLIPESLMVDFYYQVSKNNNVLSLPQNKISDALYRVAAKEIVLSENPLFIPYVEITISPQCTLHCLDCANLMQFYEKPKKMDLEQIILWTSNFLEAVDYILMFRVMGGEPLMQKELALYIEFLKKQDKIRHIQIVTNGTLLLSDDQVKSLSANYKCSLYLSHYPADLATNYDALIRQCNENAILCDTTEELCWQDMGGFHARNQNPNFLTQVYQECPMECRHIWNGEFHVCPRSAHGMYLNLIPRDKNYYVDLLEPDILARRNAIRNLYAVPYINACGYCNNIHERTIIPAARQKNK